MPKLPFPPPIPKRAALPVVSVFSAMVCLMCLWLGAAFFLGGDYGFWNDDYFIASVDPVTGERTRWIMDQVTPFEPRSSPVLTWRPFYNVLLATVSGASWNAPWIAHGISALLHGANALVLAMLLRALGRSWSLVFVGAALYLAWPIAFETVFWMCAIPTAFSILALLLSLFAFVKWASRAGAYGQPSPVQLWAVAAVVFAACIPCLNEQAAGAMIALPALYLAVRPLHERFATSIKRLVPMLLSIGAAYVAYILMVLSNTHGGIGAAGALTPVNELLGELLRIGHDYAHLFGFRFVGIGAARTGIDAMQLYPIRSVLLVVGLVGAGAIAAFYWMRSSQTKTSPAATVLEPATDGWFVRRVFLVVGVILIAAGSLLPLAMAMGTAVRPRMASVSIIAIVILITAAAEWIGEAVQSARARGVLRWVGLTGCVVAVGFGLVSMIGIQRAYQRRTELDAHVAEQLRTTMPNPPAGTVFLPLDVVDFSTRSGTPWFDTYFVSPFYWSWGYTGYVQHTYARTDLFSGFFGHEPARRNDLWLCADERGVLFSGPMPAEFVKSENPIVKAPGKSVWLPWDRVVPFVVSETGKVSLVTNLTISRDPEVLLGPNDFEVQPALTQGQRVAGIIPRQPWRIVSPPIDRFARPR